MYNTKPIKPHMSNFKPLKTKEFTSVLFGKFVIARFYNEFVKLGGTLNRMNNGEKKHVLSN